MEFNTRLTAQYLEQLGKTQPLTGLIELIWNALDADATEIQVEFGRNDLEGIEEVRVRDNGHGMLAREIEEHFQNLGNSWKSEANSSKGGRALHGRRGQGRYRAAGIGNRIIWRTIAADPDDDGQHYRTSVTLQVSDLVRGAVAEPEKTDEPTGTVVVIPDLGMNPPVGLHGDGPVNRLTGTFALQLQNYNAHLIYDREEIDPEKAQVKRVDVDIPAEPDDALLTIVEWDRRIDRGLYLCNSRGTPVTELAPGIQAPTFEFTAYLQWTGFDDVDEADLSLLNLETGDRKELIEAAKEAMRTHFKGRLEERTREQIDKWKAEHTYPFEGEAEDPAEQTVRDVFDVVALSASAVVNPTDKRSRKFSLRLLREALEQDPGSLHRVLRDLLELPQDRLDELSGLLDRTPLASMIALSREVANRLDFIRGLDELVNNPTMKKNLKERSQLHKILADETWIFGEEYSLAVNDESLKSVLLHHINILGRDHMAEDVGPVTDLEGHQRIVDLMLSRSLPQNRNRREHLVIELKRPSVNVSDDEANQIRKYATAVAGDQRFKAVEAEWDFIVVSGDVTGSPAIERESDNRPFGQIMNAKGIRVWALTWGEVIDEALHRLKFAKEHLDYEPDNDQAFAYLRTTHDKYLPPQNDAEPDDSTKGEASVPDATDPT
jgi:hypothetical protein